eukprot:scaffold1404_cov194-Isochrysis_galbana.AAC.2
MVYGGARLAPHRLVRVSKTPHAPERGVGRPPRNSPPPSEHEVVKCACVCPLAGGVWLAHPGGCRALPGGFREGLGWHLSASSSSLREGYPEPGAR